MTHYWRIKTRLPDRFGQPCIVTAHGALNSIRVDFPDGYWVITSRWSVRRLRAPALVPDRAVDAARDRD